MPTSTRRATSQRQFSLPPKLPTELLDSILSNRQLSKPDLANCCLVNHYFLNLARPQLYRTIEIMLVTGSLDCGGRWNLNENTARFLKGLKANPTLIQLVCTAIVNGQYSEILDYEEHAAYSDGESDSEGGDSGDESEEGDPGSVKWGKEAKRMRQGMSDGDQWERDTIPQKGSRIFDEATDAVKFVIATFPRLEALLVPDYWWDHEGVKTMLEKKRSKWKYSNVEVAGRIEIEHVRVIRRDLQN